MFRYILAPIYPLINREETIKRWETLYGKVELQRRVEPRAYRRRQRGRYHGSE